MNTTTAAGAGARAREAAIDLIFGADPPAFAMVHRPAVSAHDHLEVLVGDVVSADGLADLRLPEPCPVHVARHDLMVLVPYRQVAEKGFACHDDQTPLLAITVRAQRAMGMAELTRRTPAVPVKLRGGGFDIDDESYGALVRTVLADEIGQGEGSNFVIKRTFVADVENYSMATALTIFRRLMGHELGAYWTFIVHTGSRTLIGATPERHVSLDDGVAVMNPISGTYRYPRSGPTLAGVLRFLADRKEADELYMVLDEELKMMGRLCESGGRVEGPFLKEMAAVAHTEYLLRGRSSLDVRQILRETLLAPTVTGSPVQSACRVIERYETRGRGYYGGVAALIGRTCGGRVTLDSSIIIRTADIDEGGRLEIGVGATLVRHSVPAAEVAETRAKAEGLLAVFDAIEVRRDDGSAGATGHAGVLADPSRVVGGAVGCGALGTNPAVRRALVARNSTLARFWFNRDGGQGLAALGLSGRRVLILDAEDTFTSMLAHQVRSLGPRVSVRRFDETYELDRYDLVVVGPGPGDPRDRSHPKITALLAITGRLIKEQIPFVSVCLGHQILGSLLGLDLVRLKMPNQGTQREIDFFGVMRRVGFYNTFALRCDADYLDSAWVPGPIDVSADAGTGEVFGLRGPGFRSAQFHPESVLTENGPAILAELLMTLPRVTPTQAASRAVGTNDIDVMRGELERSDVELLGLVQRRTALSRELGAARLRAGGTRFVHAAELSVAHSYRQLGPSGVELAAILLRLGR